jgi:hypothetical protein
MKGLRHPAFVVSHPSPGKSEGLGARHLQSRHKDLSFRSTLGVGMHRDFDVLTEE